MAHRVPFDIKKPLVAAREFTFAGDKYAKGDQFPRLGKADSFNHRLIKRQYESLAVNHTAEADPADAPIQMTGPQGGRYTITAPWLEKPEIVRGKANADKRLAELTAEGAPLGFIAGGSEVTVEGGDGGWFEVNAPWLDEPEKVQGREAAEARQRFLHDGKPEGFKPKSDDDKELEEISETDALVIISIDGDAYTLTAPWLEAPETFDNAEAADARQAEVRAAGPPEGWTPAPETAGEADQGGEGGEGAETPAKTTEGADAPAGGGTLTIGKTQSDGDPHKGAAEKIAGTGPAQAADDVAAAAGAATGNKGGADKTASK